MPRFSSSLLTRAALAVALMVPVTGSAQRDRHHEREDFQDAESRIDTTFAFDKNGSVDLTEVAGDVVVNAWNRNQARVRAYADSVIASLANTSRTVRFSRSPCSVRISPRAWR